MKKPLLLLSVVACLCLVLLFGSLQASAQAGITNFDNVTISSDLLVGDDGTFGGNMSVAGTLIAAEFVTDVSDVTLPGDVVVSDTLTVNLGATVADLTVTDDTVLGDSLLVTGATTLVGTANLQGNLSDSGGVLTVVDNVMIDGQADAVQLTVQGNATNTSLLFVVENSGGADQFSVGNTGDAIVGDDLTVTDDASANDLTIADYANITAQSVLTLTNGAVFTPTGSLQPLAAAAALGVSGANIAHVVDFLMLVNIGGQTITITETTGLISAGNIALGAGDAATLVWANGGWIQVSGSNN